MKASDLKKGTKYSERGMIFEVKRITMITNKSITFITKRIAPDYYDADIFNRKGLNTLIKTI